MQREVNLLETSAWALTLRGIVAVLFGIAAVFWPHLTLVTLVYLFGVWVLVDGVIRIVVGATHMSNDRLSILTLIAGLIELGFGVYLLRHPAVSFTTLILLVGFLLIIAGVIELVSAIVSRDSATNTMLTVIVGAVSAIAGVLVLFQPTASGVAFVWILGLYALLAGPLMIAMSVDAHAVVREFEDKRRR